MAGNGVYRRGGPYKFTARRRYALKRAQEISARKRKSSRNKRIGVAAGAIAGVAVAGYLGTRSRRGISGTNGSAVIAAVQPGAKEQTRVSNAVSVGSPSRTQTTRIGPGERARAQATRDALAKAALPPHMGGRDPRRYNDDDTVNSEAMTNQGVRQTLRKAKAKTTGRKTESLKSTPGGTKTPAKAIPHRPETWKDEDWADALAFDTSVRRPISGGSSGGSSRPVPQRDPLHTLAKQRYDDERLLGSQTRAKGDTDAFLRNAGTSRPVPRRKIKKAT